MQRDLVERRAWLSRPDFIDGVALGQTMPGPLAAQVVMWFGYLKRGARGALATSAVFILPSFVLVLGVAVLYVQYQGLGLVQAIFYGVAPAVMAVITSRPPAPAICAAASTGAITPLGCPPPPGKQSLPSR